jgi:hypothetical protein
MEPETSGATLAPGCVARPSPGRLICCVARALAAAWARAIASATLPVALVWLTGAADSTVLTIAGASSHFRFLRAGKGDSHAVWLRGAPIGGAPSRGCRSSLRGDSTVIRPVAHQQIASNFTVARKLARELKAPRGIGKAVLFEKPLTRKGFSPCRTEANQCLTTRS